MVRSSLAIFALCMMLSATGCGEKDLNKDLKPISPNAQKPTSATVDNKAGAQKAPEALK